MVRVAFVHPDLGIGGAERLVVDASVALQSRGHQVHMYTAHHDTGHCFRETRDGTLAVTCAGDWLPRKIFGRMYALCAYFRMIYLAMYILLCRRGEYDVFFCDQVSACIPILKLSGARVIFYCHFPDKLLTERDWWAKKAYRKPLDWWEEKTTGMAHVILVNSNYTAKVFHDSFKSLRGRTKAAVLYPSLHPEAFDAPPPDHIDLGIPKRAKFVLVSINRYERKKNLGLCLEALHLFMRKIQPQDFDDVHLVIPGGYDERVTENKEYYNELREQAVRLGVEDQVTFLRSISHNEKLSLLHHSTLLLYTPENEHFGIVPLEAMYIGTPVIASNSGGPLETIVNGETGYLTNPDPASYAQRLLFFFHRPEESVRMGDEAKKRVITKFSFNVFAEKLDAIVQKLMH